MLLKNGGGTHIGDRAFQSGFDSFSFAQIWHRVDDAGSLHALFDGHGNRLFGHIVDGGEPAFAELLLTAAQFEVDHDVGAFGFEVSRGIVEGEVAVFTDTDESNVDGVFGNGFFPPMLYTEIYQNKINSRGSLLWPSILIKQRFSPGCR